MDQHIRRFAHRRAAVGAEQAAMADTADIETEAAWFYYIKALMHRRADFV